MSKEWVKEDANWYFYENSKKLNATWVKHENRMYYLEKDGRMVKGWFQTTRDNNWYYAFYEEIVKDNKVFYEGQICTGWLELKDVWYYFEEYDEENLGAMYCNGTFFINNKYQKFDYNGVWLEEDLNYNISSKGEVSDEFCEFVAFFEGCRLNAYYCPSGVKTIGIGCTRNEVTRLGTITKERAYEEFRKDIKNFLEEVDILCSRNNVNLNKFQREALISFSFNCGIITLENSTLWKNIKNKIRDYSIIKENFLRYVKGYDGKVIPGLVNRRKAEAELFLCGRYKCKRRFF
ncbi:putative lysozyme [Clostridium neonatale]|uniref:glycoside hydrolase family protein n=1 Tax=Clostridium neonatale TaxID=137838 RepID=UPI00291C459C|nr:glycoside hydrolase family protein [Clostridium neonatale]CAI3232674.1 putative lysozyme [Clostridium neonatale]